ncbi:DUF5684 domain-containing protein [Vitiosangium sp. GDMCC 1.1324]|uniref:DUF5684 domain-containing protein n=1 Tax=Vitiosangium sp. (strain GDMCC 1.1324) TaxID=2138576 RepID=UPI000D38D5E3|nr:DUF5684 domain-containing protein [Vitiosangium sp. GDMCC 1.1324]PTL83875.1 signal peptidase I [Vitiosangium sp. GDMCC 1.1324]
MDEQAQFEAAQQQAAAGGIFGMLVGLAFGVLFVIAMWKIFTKAGEPGWAAIVPIYNAVVMLKIAGKPVWWLVLFFIPLVNFVAIILTYVGFAKAFGKGPGFAAGLIFLSPIFFLILAFGDAQYVGADDSAPAGQPYRRAA